MRRLASWSLCSMLMACGSAPSLTPAAAETAAVASARVVAPPPLRVDSRNLGHLPSSLAAAGVIDPARLSEFVAALARRFQPDETAGVEHALGLPARSLASGNLAASVGVDPSRPIQVGVARLDAAGQRVLADIRARTPDDQRGGEWEGSARAMQKAFSAHRPGPIHIRVTVPATDSSSLVQALQFVLGQRRYSRLAAPDGIESLHARRERAVAISLGPQLVVVDILVFEGVVPSPRMIAEAASRTWQSLLSPTGQAPLSADGHVARWSYAPAALSDLALLEAVSREQDRVSIDRVPTPDSTMMRAAIRAAGLRSFAGAEAPELFQRVELTLDVASGRPSIGTVTELTPEAQAAAASSCASSTSVDFPGALARFDVSNACLRTFKVPGDDVFEGALDSANFEGLLGEMGWMAWPLSAPWAPFALARVPIAERWNAGVGYLPLQRMERFGWANPSFGAPDVFWGLFPQGASAEAVACAAEKLAKGCKGKGRLKAGSAVQDLGGGRYARLIQLGNRAVLLTSKDRKAVQAMTPVLTPSPVPAMRATVSEGSTQRLMSSFGMEPESVRYTAELVIEQGRIVVKAGPGK